MNQPKPTDLISLREAIEEHNLKQGQIGCIIQILDNGDLEIEFEFDVWEKSNIQRLKSAQVEILYPEVIHDEDVFWRMVEQAKTDTQGDSQQQIRLLVERLAALSIADIIVFDEVSFNLRVRSYRWDILQAGDIAGGGLGNDGFIDFRAWLISQGKTAFYRVLENPDALADYIPEIDEYGSADVTLEEFSYIGSYAYEKKTGAELLPSFKARHRHFPDKLTGEWVDEGEVKNHFPRLAEKFKSERDFLQ